MSAFRMKRAGSRQLPVFLATLLAASPLLAAAPAVSGMNGKLSVEGGNFDGTGGSLVLGSFSMPLRHAYGFQADMATGRVLDANYTGGGGHLFWRDPAKGLLGLTGSHQSLSGTHMNRLGAEGELYLDELTLALAAGHQYGNIARKGQYQGLSARYYIQPDLAAKLGFEHSPGSNSTRLGVEWMPRLQPLSGLSLFFNAERASFNYDSLSVGVRYYFGGGDRTLRQRQREDDPDNLMQYNQPGVRRLSPSAGKQF